MLTDNYENKIFPQANPNGHILMLGKSGCGKTYAQCRFIEDTLRNGGKVLVIDWSGSFSIDELKRAQLSSIYMKMLRVINLNEEKLKIILPDEGEPAWQLAEMAKIILDVDGRRQQEILEKASLCTCREGNPSLVGLFEKLEALIDDYATENEEEQRERAEMLAERLEPLIRKNCIDVVGFQECFECPSDLIIIQISALSDRLRKSCQMAVLWSVWKWAKISKCPWQNIVLDEVQHLQVKDEVPSSLIREGRKYNISLHMSTQFLEGLDKEAIAVYQQAGNILFFQPERSSFAKVAAMIDADEKKFWMAKLRELQRGNAVICGSYTINENTKVLTKPVVVKINKKSRFRKR